jgi:pimeloyl-ACP methyl ester carboxylesterase
MGAPIAIEAALKTPEQSIGIVICDIMPGLNYNITQEDIDDDVSSSMSWVLNPNIDVMKGFFDNNIDVLAHRLYNEWKGVSTKGWAESMENFYLWLNDDCIDAVDQLQIPVLSIKAGSQEGDVNSWRQYIPSYSVRLIDNVKHQLNWENPELFNQYLEESIQEILSNQ